MAFLYQKAAGNPIEQAILPRSLRDVYHDTDANSTWLAIGLTANDWIRVRTGTFKTVSADYAITAKDDGEEFLVVDADVNFTLAAGLREGFRFSITALFSAPGTVTVTPDAGEAVKIGTATVPGQAVSVATNDVASWKKSGSTWYPDKTFPLSWTAGGGGGGGGAYSQSALQFPQGAMAPYAYEMLPSPAHADLAQMMSFGCWLRFTSDLPATEATIAEVRASMSTNYAWRLTCLPTGQLSFTVTSDGGMSEQNVVSMQNIAAGQWYQVAATFQAGPGSTLILVLNGNDDTGPGTGNIPQAWSGGEQFVFGASLDAGDSPVAGTFLNSQGEAWIDDVIYTTGEVIPVPVWALIYNAGTPQDPTGEPGLAPGSFAEWNFEGDSYADVQGVFNMLQPSGAATIAARPSDGGGGYSLQTAWVSPIGTGYLVSPTESGYDSLTNRFSYGVWFNSGTLPAGGVLAELTQTTSVNYSWRFTLNADGSLTLAVTEDGTSARTWATVAGAVMPGQWVLVSFAIDTMTDSVQIYVNDSPVQTGAGQGAIITNPFVSPGAMRFVIGAQLDVNDQPIGGTLNDQGQEAYIDDPVFSFINWTAQEVSDLYNAGTPVSPGDVLGQTPTHWNFEGITTGQDAPEVTGSGQRELVPTGGNLDYVARP